MCVRNVLDSLGGRLEVVRASEMTTDLDACGAWSGWCRGSRSAVLTGSNDLEARGASKLASTRQVLTILTASGPEPTYFDPRGRPIQNPKKPRGSTVLCFWTVDRSSALWTQNIRGGSTAFWTTNLPRFHWHCGSEDFIKPAFFTSARGLRTAVRARPVFLSPISVVS